VRLNHKVGGARPGCAWVRVLGLLPGTGFARRPAREGQGGDHPRGSDRRL